MSSLYFGRVQMALVILLCIFLLAPVASTGVSAPGEGIDYFLPLGGEEPDSSLEISVSPASVTDWTLNVGDNFYTAYSTIVTITATLYSSDEAYLNVKEAANGNNAADGRMYSATVDAIDGEDGILTNALEIDATTDGANDITALSYSDQPLYTLIETGSTEIDFDYGQKIGPLDNPAPDYGIVVTFTGQIVQQL